MKLEVFISSNIEEFKEERKLLRDELLNDPILNKFIEPYLFEYDGAKSQSADEVFINEVEYCDIYIGLIGSQYGDIYRHGYSATEYEYDTYMKKHADAYLFVKNVYTRDDGSKSFLNRISKKHKYKEFNNPQELVEEVKKSILECIQEKLNPGTFDVRLLKNSSCDDVDPRAIEIFFNSLTDKALKQLKGLRDLDKILEYIGAGEIDELGNFNLNTAGALFFAKDISKFRIDHDIKMVRFNGNERLEIIDRFMSKSPFFILLEEFDEFFWKNTKLGAVVEGMKRVDIPEYPIKAIREGFVNALAHRNYELIGNCITFYIYDNRIEIISPGELPYPMTLETLGIEENPKHRNENICRIFGRTKYMEHVGTGIKRMRDEMRDAGLKEPEFFNHGFFGVRFFGPDGKLIYKKENESYNFKDLTEYNLNERQLEALRKIVNEKFVFTYKTYCKYFNVSRTTSRRDLDDLVEKKLIKNIKLGKEKNFSMVR